VLLVTNADQPAAVQAVSLALGVLRHAGVGTWAELVEHFRQIPDGLALSEDQLRLLAEWEDLFPHISWGQKSTGDLEAAATVSLAVCPECGRWEQVVGPASTRCRLKLQCAGVAVKAAVAPRELVSKAAPPTHSDSSPQQPELLDAEPCNRSVAESVDPGEGEF
jgi:hypothetical protein